jgi:hypothetical protein
MWWLILLLIACSVPGSVPSEPPGQKSPENAEGAGLKLNIVIEGQESCSGDDEAYSEVLHMIARYTNKTETPVTVFPGSDVATEIFVARTTKDLKAGRFESEARRHVFPANGDRYLVGQNPKDQRPTVVQPGQSVEGKNTATVSVRKLESANVPGTIVAGGKHALQIGMLLKILANSNPDKEKGVHRKQQREYRWVFVRSEPVEVDIPAKPELRDCSPRH